MKVSTSSRISASVSTWPFVESSEMSNSKSKNIFLFFRPAIRDYNEINLISKEHPHFTQYHILEIICPTRSNITIWIINGDIFLILSLSFSLSYNLLKQNNIEGNGLTGASIPNFLISSIKSLNILERFKPVNVNVGRWIAENNSFHVTSSWFWIIGIFKNFLKNFFIECPT